MSSKKKKVGGPKNRQKSTINSAPISLASYQMAKIAQRLTAVETTVGPPVLVDRKDAKSVSTVEHSVLKDAKHNIAKYGRNATLRTRVWEKIVSTAAANTPVTAVSTLTPLNIAEAKSLATLFDVVRCHGIEVHNHINFTTGAGLPSNPVLDCDWAEAYDPGNATAFGAVAGVLQSKYHTGPNTGMPAGFASTPTAYTKSGMMVWNIKVPTLVDPGILADLLDGNWVSAQDTGVIVGYLKPYVETPGAAVLAVLDHYVGYDLEYRFRS